MNSCKRKVHVSSLKNTCLMSETEIRKFTKAQLVVSMNSCKRKAHVSSLKNTYTTSETRNKK